MSTQDTSQEVISAAWWNKWAFVAYILALIIVLILTVLVGVFGSKLQSAIQKDAEAKIATAHAVAETAKKDAAIADANAADANAVAKTAEEGAAKANERAQNLEQENIQLRTDLEKTISEASVEKQKIVKLQIQASSLQIEAANARKKQAEAEQALLELQERIRPRHLTAQQRSRLAEILSASTFKGAIEIQAQVGDAEAYNFAVELKDVLQSVGWKPELNSRVMIVGTPAVGLILKLQVAQGAPDRAIVLGQALTAIGFSLAGQIDPGLPSDSVILLVGSKP